VIVVAVGWYLRYGLSYRDVEELLVERGVEVDHVTVYRWVQRFSPLLADAARFCRHSPGDRWFVDETYIKVNDVWRYVYRAVDQYGQVIDVLISARRDANAARRFFHRALTTLKVRPSEVVTDGAPVFPGVLDELIPPAWHHVERHANNRVEADHSQLKHRLRPMRGLGTDRTASSSPGTPHAEPSTRPLRTGPGRTARIAGRRGVHRTRPSDLTADRATAHPAARHDNATGPADAYNDPSTRYSTQHETSLSATATTKGTTQRPTRSATSATSPG
jgi:transposase-like protein